ncbi:unnamed protein product [Rotaria socialis]|uniref:Rab-GAP TBC domain-containing protein n=2 Tax=Rotaria socialis TaxID=392032 RepID=A0A818E8U3_9BILA|nr:unnamed protein product [Rotaria socialis]CAF4141457.1 unnamed protein product [Rotaria socialis]
MSPQTENKMNASQTSTSSALLKGDSCQCNSIDEVVTTYSSKLPSRQLVQDIRLPNIVVFYISINNFNQYESRKKFSVDIQLVSYSFLIRLVNRTFNLQSNFTLIAKEASAFMCNIPVTNDFDVDGCIMNALEENDDATKQQSSVEFIVYVYPRAKRQIQSDTDDWCILDETGTNSNDKDDNFEVIEIQNDSILVTIKPKDNRQESFLQKATGWLHGSANATSNSCLTKKEFYQMLDPVTGRLLDEQAFRQKIFDNGCDESIRKIVWCYLLRVFNESMTNDDKKEYTVKATERYNEMKTAWQNRYKLNDSEIIALENLIQKDVQRTDRAVKFFDDKENSSGQKLFQILMTYSVYHPEPGYVQGMNDMAAPILYVIPDESLAYACFCAIMRHMTSIFHPNGIGMNRRLDLLRKTIRAIDLELWTKIEQCDIGNLMFTFRWLLLDCKREFPFKDTFRVFETIWASLPVDRFELNNDNTLSDRDDLCPSMLCNQHRDSMLSSISNTILSSRSSSPTLEDAQSSLDGCDSGYRDEQIPGLSDFNSRSQKYENSTCLTSKSTLSTATCVPLGKWLIHFSSVDDENHFSDMFTIFLCVALLEQNRSSILQISPSNGDSDDFIGSYFTRLVRQHDARHALQLARNYHRQYVLFQMRIKQLLLTDN